MDRNVIKLTLLGQLGLSLGLALVVALAFGSIAAKSVLLGGLIAVLPNAFLGRRLLGSGDEARDLLKAAWVGEIGKLVMTAILFGFAFVVVQPMSAPALFGGFIAAQMVVFGAPLLGSKRLDGKVDTKN
jgi:ATP synthase protein I